MKKREKLSSQQRIFKEIRPIKNGWNNKINGIPFKESQTASQEKIIDQNLIQKSFILQLKCITFLAS